MVVVILGICAAVILPQISNRDDLKTAAMARVVMNDIAYAQNLAVSRQARVFVRFDVANKRYDLLDRVSPSDTFVIHPVRRTAFRVPIGGMRKDGLKDVMLESAAFDTRTAVMFDEMGVPHAYNPSNGSAAPLVSGSVALKCRAYGLTITIDPYSGELKVN